LADTTINVSITWTEQDGPMKVFK